MSESFQSGPLATAFPQYLYEEFADDVNLQGFVLSFNTIAQGYIDWFNGTPLAVYTNSAINGLLLDWTAQGIYGISRPVLSSLSTNYRAGLDSRALNAGALNSPTVTTSGTATIANDDIYKRVLTWHLYRGDEMVASMFWLRRRVARFIYGTNGGDIPVDDLQNIGLTGQPLAPPAAPSLSSTAGGILAAATYYARLTYTTSLGETTAGTESNLAVAADNLLVIASPGAATGTTGYNVYVATLSGTETKQNGSPIPIGTNWTEPTSGLISGAAMPSSNTSVPAGNIIITVPSGTNGTFFQQCVANDVLALPFQTTFTVQVAA